MYDIYLSGRASSAFFLTSVIDIEVAKPEASFSIVY